MDNLDVMRVLSINVGAVKNLTTGAGRTMSAIEKRASAIGTRFDDTGVDGDEIADSRYHGGADQAVYVYSANDYDWWSAELNRDLKPGLFGENLTIEGLPSDLTVGDRLVIGTTVLEVSGPRVPCHKLGLVMEDSEFPTIFRNAERPGAYCRVLSRGIVRPGDVLSLVTNPDGRMSVCEMFRLYYAKPSPIEQLRIALSTPLAARLREKFQSRLEKGTTIAVE